jgi:hypothetical protein
VYAQIKYQVLSGRESELKKDGERERERILGNFNLRKE